MSPFLWRWWKLAWAYHRDVVCVGWRRVPFTKLHYRA